MYFETSLWWCIQGRYHIRGMRLENENQKINNEQNKKVVKQTGCTNKEIFQIVLAPVRG